MPSISRCGRGFTTGPTTLSCWARSEPKPPNLEVDRDGESHKQRDRRRGRRSYRGSKKPADTVATATEADIARRAYELYLAGGCVHGRDVEDWLQAEQELM